MAGKKTGKRLLTWVLVLVMALSLLPLNALAAGGPETDSSSGMIFTKQLVSDEPDNAGNYTIQITAQATGTTTTTTTVKPMDIVLVLDQSGSMGDEFDNGTRQSAMIAAVNSFIGEVANKYSPNADHHMAIVTFGSNADTLENWTAVDSDGATKLTGKISALSNTPSGATNVGAGMTETQSLMSNAPTGQNRQKTVIVFTDGVPTTETDFNTTVANTAIDAAKNMKSDDVTIYTVGIFNGANPNQLHGDKWNYETFEDVVCDGSVGSCWGGSWLSDLFGSNDFASIDVPAGNRFLNYLSSNSKNASKIGITKGSYHPGHTFFAGGTGWRIDENADCTTTKGYYMTASTASSLNGIFKTISDTVPEPDNAALDEKTVITDTLSDYFTFATDKAAESVTVYAEYADGTVKQSKDATKAARDGVVVNGKTVTVTGYDFSAHHTTSSDPEKLVIEIKVKPSGKGYDSDKIPTNKDNATVTLDTEEIARKEPPFVKGYSVEYVIDDDDDDASWPNNEAPEKLYYPKDVTITVTDKVPTREGWEFTGWEITAPKDGKLTLQNGKFTMPAADVTLTAQWREIEAPEPALVTLSDAEGYSLIKKHLTVNGDGLAEDTYFVAKLEAVNDLAKGVLSDSLSCSTSYMTATGNDVFTFNDTNDSNILTFSDPGEYTFKVTEENLGVKYMQYDDTVYTMTVNVTKDATENKLNAAVSFTKGEGDPTSNITFNNTYKTPVIPTYTFDLNDSDIITVNKKFESKYGLGSPMMRFTATATIEKQESYTVEVDPDLPINPYPNNGSAVTVEPTYKEVGKATGTVTLRTGKTTKAFDFGENSKIPLEPGDYRITVKETNGGDRYVTYDTETYTSPTFTVNDKGEIVGINTPITCTFTNVYTKRHTAAAPSKPTLNTGDHYAYVMGYPDGTVRPNGSITRAEVSAILFRLLSDKTRDEYFTTESSFTDVKAGAWYNNSIATLEKAGVIVDTAKGGAFRPNEAITRAELAAMLAQFSDAKPVKGVKFSDVSAEHWAYEAIAIAAKMGWIEGYPDGTFRPDATITRAEMMTLVNRALERVPSDEDHLLSKRVMLTFPDCKSGDWFYIAVQEATNSHTYERAATEKNGDEQWTALRANRDWTLLEK